MEGGQGLGGKGEGVKQSKENFIGAEKGVGSWGRQKKVKGDKGGWTET